MVERATWWVLPGLLRNSNKLSGYVCNMSLVDALLSGQERKMING